jgi:hypothetical protein
LFLITPLHAWTKRLTYLPWGDVGFGDVFSNSSWKVVQHTCHLVGLDDNPIFAEARQKLHALAQLALHRKSFETKKYDV